MAKIFVIDTYVIDQKYLCVLSVNTNKETRLRSLSEGEVPVYNIEPSRTTCMKMLCGIYTFSLFKFRCLSLFESERDFNSVKKELDHCFITVSIFIQYFV